MQLLRSVGAAADIWYFLGKLLGGGLLGWGGKVKWGFIRMGIDRLMRGFKGEATVKISFFDFSFCGFS